MMIQQIPQYFGEVEEASGTDLSHKTLHTSLISSSMLLFFDKFVGVTVWIVFGLWRFLLQALDRKANIVVVVVVLYMWMECTFCNRTIAALSQDLSNVDIPSVVFTFWFFLLDLSRLLCANSSDSTDNSQSHARVTHLVVVVVFGGKVGQHVLIFGSEYS